MRFAGISVSDRRSVVALIGCVVLLAGFVATAWRASLTKSAAFDEPLHFTGAWVQDHYDDFRCNPEDPPLWKYYVVAGTRAGDMKIDVHSELWKEMLLEVPAPAAHFARETMYQTPGTDADRLLRAAHIRMLALGAILGAAIGWWAWRLAGPIAGVVAVAAYSFDPNFLAHAPLVKNDVPITLAFFLLMGFVWLSGERVTLLRFMGISLLTAIGLTTKFSGVLAFPMVGIALVCRGMINKPWPVFRWTLVNRWQRFGAGLLILFGIAVVGYVGIWASYGFRFSPAADDPARFDFHSANYNAGVGEMLLRQDPVPVYPSDALLHEWVRTQWKPSLVVRAVNAANKMRLLPQAWLFGFLYTYGTSLYRRTFLCGEIGIVGWWYYFPAAMAFKTPLATLVGLGLAAAIYVLRVRRRTGEWNTWAICAGVVGPVFYMGMAMRGDLDIGLRHVFPVYPFLFLFLGVIAARSFAVRPKISGWILSLLFVGLACETWSAYPDFIPFFNAAVGGSRGGLALLSDSNIDWGQDLPALAKWQSEHQDRQLYFCHFGMSDPRYYKLHYIEMDGSQMPQVDETAPSGLRPEFAISAVGLQGTYMTPAQLNLYRRFQKEKPAEILDGTIYLFDAPPPP